MELVFQKLFEKYLPGRIPCHSVYDVEILHKAYIALGYPDEPVMQANVKSIYKKYGLDAEGIAQAVRNAYEN